VAPRGGVEKEAAAEAAAAVVVMAVAVEVIVAAAARTRAVWVEVVMVVTVARLGRDGVEVAAVVRMVDAMEAMRADAREVVTPATREAAKEAQTEVLARAAMVRVEATAVVVEETAAVAREAVVRVVVAVAVVTAEARMARVAVVVMVTAWACRARVTMAPLTVPLARATVGAAVGTAGRPRRNSSGSRACRRQPQCRCCRCLEGTHIAPSTNSQSSHSKRRTRAVITGVARAAKGASG
jgi:hypothetical protein